MNTEKYSQILIHQPLFGKNLIGTASFLSRTLIPNSPPKRQSWIGLPQGLDHNITEEVWDHHDRECNNRKPKPEEINRRGSNLLYSTTDNQCINGKQFVMSKFTDTWKTWKITKQKICYNFLRVYSCWKCIFLFFVFFLIYCLFFWADSIFFPHRQIPRSD